LTNVSGMSPEEREKLRRHIVELELELAAMPQVWIGGQGFRRNG
jgi:hypothetical protein